MANSLRSNDGSIVNMSGLYSVSLIETQGVTLDYKFRTIPESLHWSMQHGKAKKAMNYIKTANYINGVTVSLTSCLCEKKVYLFSIYGYQDK